METVFRIVMRGYDKIYPTMVKFKEEKSFDHYPSEEEIEEFFKEECRDKTPQFVNNFNWELSVDKVFIPKMS